MTDKIPKESLYNEIDTHLLEDRKPSIFIESIEMFVNKVGADK